jgi:cytochrome oxidase assembly protein ShyY1
MTGWRFAFTRRWAGYLALVVVFATVCSALGMWQFARRTEAQQEIARIDANYDATPVPLDDVLATRGAFEDDQRWTPVVMEGRYLVDDQLLVRNRPLAGRPGFEIITPLLLDDGTVFVADRGWVPTGSAQDSPDVVPNAPSGRVTVIARVKAGEPEVAGSARAPGSGQLQTIHLETIQDILDRPTYTGAYGLVVDETPAPEAVPERPDRPERDEGPHLSYALQWFVFALLAFVALGWALRQEYRAVNADDPDEQERSDARERRRATRAPDDAEVEDAILDSQPSSVGSVRR